LVRHGRWAGGRRAERPCAGFLPRSFQFVILDHQELIFANLIAAGLVVGFHHLSRDGINQLLA
jgi:hypothetical protein